MTVTYVMILLTWVVYVGGLLGVGLLAARLLFPRALIRDSINAAVWWGLALFILIATGLGLVTALSSTVGLATVTVLLGVGWVSLIVLTGPRIPAAWRLLRATWSWRRIPALLTAALFVLAELMIVRFAAGSPMDGDSGLYRVGAITYAARYGPVPGLANLHDRFGFNTTTSTAAALMDNGLWAGHGFRLVAGLCLSALILATVLRLLFPHRDGASAGDWFSVIGTAFVVALVLTDSGRWVPAPASDLLVAIFGVAATCFLLDALKGRAVPLTASTALVAAATAGSIRPLGWVAAATTAAVLLLRVEREPHGGLRVRRAMRAVLPGGVVAGALLLVMLGRDALLSGWLLYPSTLLGLDVPWRTVPGTSAAEWITSWGRAPNVDKAIVLADNAWFLPWVERFWQSRELRLNIYVAVALMIPLLHASGRRAWRSALPILPWAWLPTLVTAAVWFLTAPDVRFGWLAFVGLSGIPLALLLALGAYPPMLARFAGVAVLAVMAASNVANGRVAPRGAEPVPATLSWGPVAMSVRLGPHPPVVLSRVTMHDGTPAWLAGDNQCWDIVPNCLNTDPSRIYMLGPEVQDGYATLDRDPQ